EHRDHETREDSTTHSHPLHAYNNFHLEECGEGKTHEETNHLNDSIFQTNAFAVPQTTRLMRMMKKERRR
ncbi:hypothetical protein PMAYCL1PPCAC_23083, partial [Pristionchus mayeri]